MSHLWIEGQPDEIPGIGARTGWLPRFVTDRLSPIALAMPVARRDTSNEFFKGVRRPTGPNDDRSVLDRHVDGITCIDIGFERDRLR
jgi:hypothetical protein